MRKLLIRLLRHALDYVEAGALDSAGPEQFVSYQEYLAARNAGEPKDNFCIMTDVDQGSIKRKREWRNPTNSSPEMLELAEKDRPYSWHTNPGALEEMRHYEQEIIEREGIFIPEDFQQ